MLPSRFSAADRCAYRITSFASPSGTSVKMLSYLCLCLCRWLVGGVDGCLPIIVHDVDCSSMSVCGLAIYDTVVSCLGSSVLGIYVNELMINVIFVC